MAITTICKECGDDFVSKNGEWLCIKCNYMPYVKEESEKPERNRNI